jgi:DNA mismatch repair protein MutS
MMAQYEGLKQQHPDCLLFFRLGDFYELFNDDAREASRLLGLTLTARSSGQGRSQKVPMAGIPYHAAPAYIHKLLKAGRKVAVVEQIGEAKKGMMRRELVRIVTPGTALEDNFLDSKANNWILSLTWGKEGLGFAAADNSTGEFTAQSFLPQAWDALDAELERLKPLECLLPEGAELPELEALLASRRILVSRLDPYAFSPEESARLLKEQFQVLSLESFGLQEGSLSARAAGALLRYLRDTQKGPLDHLRPLRDTGGASNLRLDASTLRNLELTANLEDGGTRGTLFEVLDDTVTASGARLLKRWLTAPLTDLEAIQARLDAVQELRDSAELCASLREELRQTSDVERIMAKVGCQSASARDLAGLRDTLRRLPALQALLTRSRATPLQGLAAHGGSQDLCARLCQALVDEPPAVLRDGHFIRPGFHAQLDTYCAEAAGGKDAVAALQARERQRSGIENLKVQFNSIFGFYIEISKAQLAKAPADYERKQTLVSAERFTTPELKALEDRVLHADERRVALELELFAGLRQEVAQRATALLALAATLASLDTLCSLAEVARRRDYVRPVVDNSTALVVREGRHPVIDAMLRDRGGEPFAPNDLELDCEGCQIMLLTGPNMAGKSTYMRMAALLALMAQAGSFVPAREARIGWVDRIFTRVGASDRLQRGMSTFLVEMVETANILHNATRRSLVVLDEIGRGTSTFDGIGIAYAVAEHLHESPQLGCRTLFATHYFELTELEEEFPRIRNFQVMVREWNGKIIFLHQVRPGSSEHSYGVAVARLAGLPESVLNRAREVLARLELSRPASLKASAQGSLFEAPAEDPKLRAMADELAGLDLDAMTPLQAMAKLAELKQNLR